MQVEYMSWMKWWMQKYHKKYDKVHYISKNYVLKLIYNDEIECINCTLSPSNMFQGLWRLYYDSR